MKVAGRILLSDVQGSRNRTSNLQLNLMKCVRMRAYIFVCVLGVCVCVGVMVLPQVKLSKVKLWYDMTKLKSAPRFKLNKNKSAFRLCAEQVLPGEKVNVGQSEMKENPFPPVVSHRASLPPPQFTSA